MRKLSLLVGASIGAGVWLLAAGSALAGPGESTGGSTPNGYEVSVSVTYSGDAAPAGGGSTSVSIPARCWWEVWFTEATDAQAWFENFAAANGGSSSWYGGYFPSTSWFSEAVERESAGEDMTWYQMGARDSMTYEETQECLAAMGGPTAYGWQTYMHPAPAAAPVPPPVVDPEDLAEAARDAMVIEDPQVDRNPKVDALGASTFVGLPTWFWVENAEAALGGDGIKFIHAQVDGTNVWAEVTAQTDGLNITSPAGDVTCESERATTPWAPGTPEAAGCSLGFRRASVGYANGFPVEASTVWTATWSGSDGTVGAALPGTTRQTPFAVPVAESQAIVSRTR